MSLPPELDTSLPDPETVPASDEQPIEFGPNLAFGNDDLCKDVLSTVYNNFYIPYVNQQRLLWPVWRKIDDMWRNKINATDLDFPMLNRKIERQTKSSKVDGISAMAQSPAGFKQMKALTDIIHQMSWQDGAPGQFRVPECTYEHPLYNPTQQGVDAMNEILDESIQENDVEGQYRVNIGQYVKYGHAWVMPDFEKELEVVKDVYRLQGLNAQTQVQMLMQKYQQEPTFEESDGMTVPVSFKRKVIKKMGTKFIHLNVRDVFIDQTLPCDSEHIHLQPCPLVRKHITEYTLEDNEYHPTDRPFGWVNTKEAALNQKTHYAPNQPDEQTNRDAMLKRYGPENIPPTNLRDAVKQLWTFYPLLRIHNGVLDKGEGLPCEHCQGKGKMTEMVMDAEGQFQPVESTCQECGGEGKIHPKAERYVCQAFGGMQLGGTILRIQKLPKQLQSPPLLFAADMVEDDATAIPTSRAEVALIPMYQLSKAELQMQDSKDFTIYRPWKVREDSPSRNQDLNDPGSNIFYESDPREVERADGNQYDETITLLTQIQRKEDDVQRIFGATDQLLGLLASGRRSAMEVGNALEAGKNPIIVMANGYNKQIFGGWMKWLLKNLELFGDRDWIKRKTGKVTFGKPKIYTSTASDFFRKSVMLQNVRYLLEAANLNPALQSAVPQLFNESAKMMGIPIQVDDGGLKKIQQDGMKIVAQILGDGVFIPPLPNDPHEAYLEIFYAAAKDDYWLQHAPQNMPLLMQRIQMEQQLLLQQQIQQMQMQLAMQPPPEEGRPPNQKKGNEPADTPGKAMQSAQG